jgi:hypothetical protein
MVDVGLADGTVIEATDGHPFWDVTTGAFTDAIDLQPGELVLTLDGQSLQVTAVRVHAEDLTAYNLEIDGIHTYYAGETPVLVHNSCGPLTQDTILMRGGENTPSRFANGSGVTASGGQLSGVSVNSGTTMQSAAAGIPHSNVGVTTVGQVEAAGGSVVRAPTANNPGHCIVSGCSAQTLSDLFTPVTTNIWR